ncbi:hypothetical protein glysoja_034715 [Glycine soja]|uniref:Uncharacterized protein n=1 Tax=Glycine soja TaxID=3848 RepID=A0A0B2QKT6_GLYSO|nr:hypothetical protein glysoja_034715 [Glycine soja]
MVVLPVTIGIIFNENPNILNQSIACCEWSGVTSDNEGHVIGLDLSGESTYGGLDNSRQPQKLESLELQNFVQSFSRIRQLYMDGVSIKWGQDWYNALLPLLSLEELSMSNCNLSGPLNSSLT